MKFLTLLGMAIVVMLSLVPLAPSPVSATSSDEIAQNSATAYIKSISADLFPQWKGGQPTFVRIVTNSQKQEIGYIFYVIVDSKAVGTLFIGSSLYNYDLMEADASSSTTQVDNTLSWFVPGMSTPKQYKIDQANTLSTNQGMSTASIVNLPVPPHTQLLAYDCAPTSGAMIMEYWKTYRGCPNLLNWTGQNMTGDHGALMTTMNCTAPDGIQYSAFCPGIQQYAAAQGYSFSYDYRQPGSTTYTLIQTDINASQPMGLMFVAPVPPDPGHHACALKGYNTTSGNNIIVYDPAQSGGGEKLINWNVQKTNCYICRFWKN